MDSFATSDELADAWSNEFARAIDVGRRRALELLDEQQRRIDSLEANLAAEIEQLLADAQASAVGAGPSREDQEAYDRLAADLAAQEAGLAERLREIETREAIARDSERGRTNVAESLAGDKRELALARERLERDRDELAAQRAELAGQRAAAELQRRRIARKLKTEWSAQREAIRRRKQELQQLSDDHHDQLQAALATARASLEEESKQKSHFQRLLRERGTEVRDLRRAVKRLKAEAERQAAERCELNAAHAQLSGASAHRDARALDEQEALGNLRQERDALLHNRLAAEQALAEREAERATFDQKYDDLQRRFEMAIADLRQYKHRCAELESRPSENEAERSDEPMDWEARKQHLLAELEMEPVDDESREKRVTIEGTIRITDEVIAQKDQEIAGLKAMLAQQSSNIGAISVGAAAFAEILDQDEFVRQERERLEHLQEECHEKLRTAEIEISLERARLARAWADMDNRLSQARPAEQKVESAPGGAASESNMQRRRWWAFLGMKDSASGG